MKKTMILSYIKLIYGLHKYLNIKLKGLGRVQRFLNKEFVFKAFNMRFFYNPSIEGSYDYLLIGKSNEPETRKFLDNLIPKLDCFTFIDVGASIGEFVNLVSSYKNNVNILAFEPRQDCADVLRKNTQLNNDNKTKIYNIALSDRAGEIQLSLNAGGSSTSIYATTEVSNKKTVVKTSRLDDLKLKQLISSNCAFIVLIDVEGAEPLVMGGALKFIAAQKPLIIFEYNNTSKKHYKLEEIKALLGDDYAIRRLNIEGKLDNDFENTWNCVAIPKRSHFYTILLK